MPFLAAAKVGLFYKLKGDPIVPDVLLSLGVQRPDDLSQRQNRSYFTDEQSRFELATGLWQPGRFAFRLTDVVQFAHPIPFKSRQGKLLDVPDEIVQAVEAIALN